MADLDLDEPRPHADQDWPTPCCNCEDCWRIRESPAYKRRFAEIRQQLLDERKSTP